MPLKAAAHSGSAAGAQPKLAIDGRLPLNRDRAQLLMKAAGIDALIGALDDNARYLTNIHSLMSDMGLPRRVIGILPADPRQPLVAIIPSIEIGRHTAPDREWPEIVTYSLPDRPEMFSGRASLSLEEDVLALQPRAQLGTGLSATEHAWAENERRLPVAMVATPELGVRKALAGLGLLRARLGVDDAGLAASLITLGLEPAKLVPAENLFLRIRQVKSAVEIERMRRVSELNSAAARASIAAFQPGMTMADIETVFFVEAIRRGGRPNFIVAGMVQGLRQGELVRHEPLLVDCAASFDGYCGDFARTVVLGTPPRILSQRTRIMGRVAEALTASLRPGQLYSEIRARGQALLKQMGGDFPMGTGPHSVGMQHSEDPWRDDLPFQVREDVRLEAGMVITIDLPTLEPGWGSMHMESLILIKPDGAEWLDRIDDPLYEI